jgi:hypothetical protein
MGTKERIPDVSMRYESDFAPAWNSAENLSYSSVPLGQTNPQHCPPLQNASDSNESGLLGPPMTIRDVAQLFGCSEWTVRQQYLRRGLPCFRLSPRGKLLFFHNQIVRWVLDRQRQKGGMIR